jgi:hypothetical protein
MEHQPNQAVVVDFRRFRTRDNILDSKKIIRTYGNCVNHWEQVRSRSRTDCPARTHHKSIEKHAIARVVNIYHKFVRSG